jgi:hypothetical protein
VSILAVVETVLLVIALVYIVALLRSHADILRRLAVLEEGGARGAASGSAPALPDDDLRRAEPISGTTLSGDAAMLSFGAGSPVTLLAFLTSGCTSCAPLWAGLRDSGELSTLADRVVVITHDPTRESPARVQRLAPGSAEVIMASAAWEDYAVPASPHFVLTDGAGGILGRGSALSWSQLVQMIDEARADGGHDARTTAERAARSEHALARAGIGPGHPSLYPGDGDGGVGVGVGPGDD